MNEVKEMISENLTKMVAYIEEASPTIWEASYKHVYVRILDYIVPSLFALIAAIIIFMNFESLYASLTGMSYEAIDAIPKRNYGGDLKTESYVCMCLFHILSFGFLLGASINMIHQVVWSAQRIINPKYYAICDIVNRYRP